MRPAVADHSALRKLRHREVNMMAKAHSTQAARSPFEPLYLSCWTALVRKWKM